MRHEEYRNSYSTEKPPTLLGALFSIVMIVFTFVAISLLALILISPYIPPSVSWIFPFIGLVAPMVYAVNLVLALYYVTRWRLRYALPIIILLLLGASNITRFIKVELTKDYGVKSYKGTTKLMTFNVRNFYNDEGEWSITSLAEYIDEVNPDIICLQEYNAKAKNIGNKLHTPLKRYNRVTIGTLAIYSRYKIIEKGDIFKEIEEIDGRTIYADLLIKNDTVRVYNCHLHATSITSSDDVYLSSRSIVRDTLRDEKIKDIIRRFAGGAKERSAQVHHMQECKASTPYPYLICGDFNDTPMSYTYNKLSQGMTDAFQVSGTGYSYTYRGFNKLFRIDYVLLSDRLSAKSYTVDEELTISDHLPVVVHFEIDKIKDKP